MANSLLVTSAILGVNVKIIAPEVLQPEDEIVALAQKHNNGADLTITDDISEVKGWICFIQMSGYLWVKK